MVGWHEFVPVIKKMQHIVFICERVIKKPQLVKYSKNYCNEMTFILAGRPTRIPYAEQCSGTAVLFVY